MCAVLPNYVLDARLRALQVDVVLVVLLVAVGRPSGEPSSELEPGSRWALRHEAENRGDHTMQIIGYLVVIGVLASVFFGIGRG
jgi:hypothetical protein